MPNLNDKELHVLDQIARNSLISQRELSRATGLSLGLINIILKRFLKTGYLQVAQLNKRKLEYLLTPSGFLAITRKTYKYATRTIRDYQQLQHQLIALLNELGTEGYKYFSIHGDGDLRELLESMAPDILKGNGATIGSEHRNDPESVVLNVTAEPMAMEFEGRIIDVMGKLGEGGELKAES